MSTAQPSNIRELEESINAALNYLATLSEQGFLPPVLEPLTWLAPNGSEASVSLCRADTGRQIRSDAGVHNWNPNDGEALITYQVREGQSAPPPLLRPLTAEPVEPTEGESTLEYTLVRVLDEAENDENLTFVAFKFLRDRLLPQTGCPWAASTERCQSLITNAIAREMVYTEKVPNPRQPEFPVTSVRLNREHPSVQEILDQLDDSEEDSESDTDPDAQF